MAISITPLYAGLLGLLFIYLSYRVIIVRRGERISLGDGDSPDMAYRIRAQANCAEYAPLGLILLAMAELQGAPIWVVHMFGLMLLTGRLIHGWALSQRPQNLKGRTYGMMLTLMMITISSITNIGHALF